MISGVKSPPCGEKMIRALHASSQFLSHSVPGITLHDWSGHPAFRGGAISLRPELRPAVVNRCGLIVRTSFWRPGAYSSQLGWGVTQARWATRARTSRRVSDRSARIGGQRGGRARAPIAPARCGEMSHLVSSSRIRTDVPSTARLVCASRLIGRAVQRTPAKTTSRNIFKIIQSVSFQESPR
jgi:hypothetical protein